MGYENMDAIDAFCYRLIVGGGGDFLGEHYFIGPILSIGWGMGSGLEVA
jgi:hypothetical protein